MVLYQNVCVGQSVEVRHNGETVCGTVRYKGCLNGVKGNWIGVELDFPLGKHNGCWRGCQYFSSSPNCGLFTHASNISFRRPSRKLFDPYKKKQETSGKQEDFFHSTNPSSSHEFNSCYSIDKNYLRKARLTFEEPKETFGVVERYALSHSVGKLYDPSKVRPASAITTSPLHSEFLSDTSYFGCNNASIPHYTMPHQVQKQQYRDGLWKSSDFKQPRFQSV